MPLLARLGDPYRLRRRRLSAISFQIALNSQKLGFHLPCDWRPVFNIITKGKKNPYSWNKEKKNRWESEWRLQAVRTAWRIVENWVEAQMASVKSQMATTQEVFFHMP